MTKQTWLTRKQEGGIVESWLEERGHSLVLLSNPGSDPEVSLESSGHGTLLGR